MEFLKVNTAIILLIVSMLTSGCKQTATTLSENNILLDSIHVKEIYHFSDNKDAPGGEISIKYIYPKSGLDQEMMNTVNRFFTKSFFGEKYENYSPDDAVKRCVEQIIESFKQIEDDYRAEAELMDKHDDGDISAEAYKNEMAEYYEYLRNEILFNKNNILSFAVSAESYSGGAHGAHGYQCYNIDLQSGMRITEQDVFLDGYEDELARIILDCMAKQYKLNRVDELESFGVFSIDEVKPNGNFSVDRDGLTYYFNEYEIAAYVVGLISVHLPYKAIRQMMRTECIVYTLI